MKSGFEGWLDNIPELIVNSCKNHDGNIVACEIDHINKISVCKDCGNEYKFQKNPDYVNKAQPAVGL